LVVNVMIYSAFQEFYAASKAVRDEDGWELHALDHFMKFESPDFTICGIGIFPM
jgi:hypothetical protein